MTFAFDADMGHLSTLLHGKKLRVTDENFAEYCGIVVKSGNPAFSTRIRLWEAILMRHWGTLNTVWAGVLTEVLERYDYKSFEDPVWAVQFCEWFLVFTGEMHNKIMELNVAYESPSY